MADFDKYLRGLLRTKRHPVVSHLCDIHFPDHDPKALKLAYKLLSIREPDIIVVGSDAADFSVLSSFAPDPDSAENTTDVLHEFKTFWIEHIEHIHSAAPNAAVVFIMGNHEARIYNFLANHAPKLRKTVEQAFIATITAPLDVHWLGNISEVVIGNLLIKHGDRHNEHVAKSMLEDKAYQVSIMAGHVHRLTSYSRGGALYPATAITSGCLCQLVPSYMSVKGRAPLRAWQQGTAFATLDTKTGTVWFENLLFSPAGKGLQTVLGGQVVSV